jgi:hypothetical protein
MISRAASKMIEFDFSAVLSAGRDDVGVDVEMHRA